MEIRRNHSPGERSLSNQPASSSARGREALLRELEFQKSRAGQIQVSPTPDYIFARYRECKLWRFIQKEFMYKVLGEVQGKAVLDFACGEGQISTQLAALGAKVTGIDLSPELISIAKKRADLDKVSHLADFQALDPLQQPPGENSFDCIFCSAALHHVDLHAVLPLLRRCLKPGGKIIIGEPVALSPALQRVRDAVPISKHASPDERQLNRGDLDYIASLFPGCRFTYFNLFARLSRFVPNRNRIDRGHPFAKFAIVLLGAIDRLLAVLPGMSRFYGAVVIVGQKPVSE